jgi:hypothetical protein
MEQRRLSAERLIDLRVRADTSSAPGGSTLDVGANAAELAELIVEPIFAKSDAAAATYAGVAFTYDI